MSLSSASYPLRQLGRSELMVSPVAMGCWPISGMTSLAVNDADSLATLRMAVERGVNLFDTAYSYGAQGESERLIGKALGPVRHRVVIATKGGVYWDSHGVRQQDARPATLRKHLHESLQRLGFDHVDLLYLHAPDPAVPVAESAGAIRELLADGATRAVGASNLNVEQLDEFQRECPLTCVQPPYNMLQRQIENDILPWCRQHGVGAVVYWPLMKGLLSGGLSRDHRFDPKDGRAKYPMFQGDEWQRNQDFLAELTQIAAGTGHTVGQLVVNWTIHQPGITAALCGAKRPGQIAETAGAMGWQIDAETLARIDAALERRGPAATGRAI